MCCESKTIAGSSAQITRDPCDLLKGFFSLFFSKVSGVVLIYAIASDVKPLLLYKF